MGTSIARGIGARWVRTLLGQALFLFFGGDTSNVCQAAHVPDWLAAPLQYIHHSAWRLLLALARVRPWTLSHDCPMRLNVIRAPFEIPGAAHLPRILLSRPTRLKVCLLYTSPSPRDRG